ncbi:MAG: 3-dehydro-L-gulonate 2-dehydrogenase [Clostridiales bacterium]|nr:3-dehydro-L-gulonate 2-dehydrogenase [Clostridiales bacterium]
MRVPFETLSGLMRGKLLARGVQEPIAADAARMLAENSLDGVHSHGANRFPRLISYLDKGYVRPACRPKLVGAVGALEQWDGQLGMGNTNAAFCMGRAVELAALHGIGCAALRNTNHWMRGGTYGIQAAKAGCAGICWTNTQPNMPAWGARDRRVGNNPLVLCVPRGDSFVLIDGAMSQFSYGAIEAARMAGRELPVPGGFDRDGRETRDPAAIEETWRVMPIGYWKGSGFSMLLDMIAAGLSGGNTVGDVGRLGGDEYALSQVFIAIDLRGAAPGSEAAVEAVIRDVKASLPADDGVEVRYPSERTLRVRRNGLERGIPVDDAVWAAIQAL